MTQPREEYPQDRGALMRPWLLRLFMERPFTSFAIRLESGSELMVKSPEAIILEPGVLVASVYEDSDRFEVFPIERIVSIRLLRT